MRFTTDLGAYLVGKDKCRFRVWAPRIETLEVQVGDKFLPLKKGELGYFEGTFDGIPAGTRYFYRLNGKDQRPDPLSHYQPDGVFGPSEVIDQNFPWTDSKWKGIRLTDYVLYELHVGTFSPDGTFLGMIPYLDQLKDLGITAIEIMPISQFSGSRNWGYDGVLHYAVQNSYGRPEDLKKLIDTCHNKGLAVVLDVVYNHLGPEGNWMHEYGPYFTDRYKTPWGAALNYDDLMSDEVKRYFVENAVYWVKNFHFDGLRLDAIQTIMDVSAKHFLEEVSEAVKSEAAKLGREVYLMGESDLNNERFVLPSEKSGLGLDSQWNDDFHHALHTLLTKEQAGYYMDYGRVDQLAKAYQDGFVYTGQYSKYRQKTHGRPAPNVSGEGFIAFGQNHDQIGNRAFGDRMNTNISFEKYKLGAAALLFSPFVPLLFMGEEYGETAPFQYFVNHKDQGLIEAVRKGRKEEFRGFEWSGDVPIPDAIETYNRSKLNHGLKESGRHATTLKFYKEIIRLSKELKQAGVISRQNLKASSENEIIRLEYKNGNDHLLVFLNFGEATQLKPETAKLQRVLDSSDKKWEGPGSQLPEQTGSGSLQLNAHSVAVFIGRR